MSVKIAQDEDAASARREALRAKQRVYFIRADGRIKIGISANPEGRLRDLRVAVPDAVLMGTISGGLDREQQIHARLKKWRVGGEWFSCKGTTGYIRSLLGRENNPLFGERYSPERRRLLLESAPAKPRRSFGFDPKAANLAPGAAIRVRCKQCQETVRQVETCEFGPDSHAPCPLYQFRMGALRKTGRGGRLRTIRAYCLWGCKGQRQEIGCCTAKSMCPLWPYRFGKRPKKEMLK